MEHAMNLRAAAHALHDLLSQVAALVKVDGAQLAGFLDQIPVRDLLAVTRAAVLDANGAGVIGRGFRNARELGQKARPVLGRSDDAKTLGACGADPRNGAQALRDARILLGARNLRPRNVSE